MSTKYEIETPLPVGSDALVLALPNNQKTMKNEIKYAVFNKTESLAESALKDLTTLAVVSLLVYVSQGSKWWTLVTGLMFIFWMVAKIAAVTKSRYKTFKTKAELQEWVDSIDCENAKTDTPPNGGCVQ